MSEKTPQQTPADFSGEIESVRGIAAFFVAFGHTFSITLTVSYGGLLSLPTSFKAFIQELFNLRISELSAVVVFFVISGYVLGKSLDRHGSRLSTIGYLDFFWRRVTRIYPAHIAALLAILLIMTNVAAQPGINVEPFPHIKGLYESFLNGSLYLQIKLGDLINQILLLNQNHYNPVIWSLHVEIVMSMLLPFLHVLVRKRQTSIDLLILTAFIAWGIYRNPVYSDHFYTLTYIPVFYAGMLVDSWGKVWTNFLVKYFWRVEIAFLAAYLLVLLPQWVIQNRPTSVIYLETFGAFSLISLLVWGPASKINKLLNHRILRWNGRVSYSFYLWHWTIMLLTCRIGFAMLPPDFIYNANELFFALMFGISLALSLAIAQLSYKFIELPFMKLGRTAFNKYKARNMSKHII